MKTIIKLAFFILIFQIYGCHTYYGLNRSELNDNYKFVEYIMSNIDSLDSIFSDTTKVDSYISLDRKEIQREIRRITRHITENKFLDGYDFVDEDLKKYEEARDSGIYYFYRHRIKIKSRYNGDIIWFVFFIDPPNTWKFSQFHFCNNYNVQTPDSAFPCDKK